MEKMGDNLQKQENRSGGVSLPVAFLPPISWWAAYVQADFVLLDEVALYRKQSIYNRAYIKTPGGKQALVCPVERPYQSIKNMALCRAEDWPRARVRALQTAYGKAAFFVYYSEPLFNRLRAPIADLFSYNMELIRLFETELNLKRKDVFFTSEAPDSLKSQAKDYRYPTVADFPPYYQLFDEFIPDLSIVDLAMNVGPESVLILKAVKLADFTWQNEINTKYYFHNNADLLL